MKLANLVRKLFVWIVGRSARRCGHKSWYRCHRFVSEDGTLMIDFQCWDCGYEDYGHVYGEDDDGTWTRLIFVRDGKVTDAFGMMR